MCQFGHYFKLLHPPPQNFLGGLSEIFFAVFSLYVEGVASMLIRINFSFLKLLLSGALLLIFLYCLRHTGTGTLPSDTF
jgi:hypothetical protein